MSMRSCAAELHISDDEGDNHATCICGLTPGHKGPHEERWVLGEKIRMVLWDGDDRGSQSSGGGK